MESFMEGDADADAGGNGDAGNDGDGDGADADDDDSHCLNSDRPQLVTPMFAICKLIRRSKQIHFDQFCLQSLVAKKLLAGFCIRSASNDPHSSITPRNHQLPLKSYVPLSKYLAFLSNNLSLKGRVQKRTKIYKRLVFAQGPSSSMSIIRQSVHNLSHTGTSNSQMM